MSNNYVWVKLSLLVRILNNISKFNGAVKGERRKD